MQQTCQIAGPEAVVTDLKSSFSNICAQIDFQGAGDWIIPQNVRVAILQTVKGLVTCRGVDFCQRHIKPISLTPTPDMVNIKPYQQVQRLSSRENSNRRRKLSTLLHLPIKSETRVFHPHVPSQLYFCFVHKQLF